MLLLCFPGEKIVWKFFPAQVAETEVFRAWQRTQTWSIFCAPKLISLILPIQVPKSAKFGCLLGRAKMSSVLCHTHPSQLESNFPSYKSHKRQGRHQGLGTRVRLIFGDSTQYYNCVRCVRETRGDLGSQEGPSTNRSLKVHRVTSQATTLPIVYQCVFRGRRPEGPPPPSLPPSPRPRDSAFKTKILFFRPTLHCLRLPIIARSSTVIGLT